jgi:hypothetical protein
MTVNYSEQTAIATVELETAGAITAENAETDMIELLDEELDLHGGAGRAGGSDFSRNRTMIEGGSFAGPDGAGNFSSVKTENIKSSAWDAAWD